VEQHLLDYFAARWGAVDDVKLEEALSLAERTLAEAREKRASAGPKQVKNLAGTISTEEDKLKKLTFKRSHLVKVFAVVNVKMPKPLELG
jgi:hypothetical protein